MPHAQPAVKKARFPHLVSPREPAHFQKKPAGPEAGLAPDPYHANCPTRTVLDQIGDKWTVLVLGLLAESPLRFNQLRRAVEGLTQKMLSQTLKALERDGHVTRTVTLTSPISVEYATTPLGSSLAATVGELQRWAVANIGEIETARERYDASAR